MKEMSILGMRYVWYFRFAEYNATSFPLYRVLLFSRFLLHLCLLFSAHVAAL